MAPKFSSKFSFDVPFPQDVVTRCLEAAVSAPRWLRIPEQPFTGEVQPTGFHIWRTFQGRNSFVAQIRGTISPSELGSRVHGEMRLPDTVFAFLFVWTALLVFMFFANFSRLAGWWVLMPPAMIVFGWSLPLLIYPAESEKASQLLEGVLADCERFVSASPPAQVGAATPPRAAPDSIEERAKRTAFPPINWP